MRGRVALEDRDLSPADIAHVVSALLEGIRRGELHASAKEVEFLASVDRILNAGLAA